MECWDHIERVLKARSLDELKQLTSAFAGAMGFQSHGYAVRLLQPASSGRGTYHYFHDYRNEWGATYAALDRPEAAQSDARIVHARTGLPAISWNTRGQFGYIRPMPALIRRARRQVQVAGEFDMTAGITIPSWSRGVDWAFMTFSTNATYDLSELGRCTASSVYFVNCLQASLDRLLRNWQAVPRLSARECEVLHWSAIGKTSWEISMILRISERTVNFHLQRAAAKLQVKGRRAACARALALGLIAI